MCYFYNFFGYFYIRKIVTDAVYLLDGHQDSFHHGTSKDLYLLRILDHTEILYLSQFDNHNSLVYKCKLIPISKFIILSSQIGI